MATSDVKVTPGTGSNVATYSITEDAETKQLQRIVLSNSTGTEILQNSNGGASVANSAPTVNADQYSQYETVAANSTAQVMGPTGATGDYLAGVLVFPGTAGCGVVTILDNATTIGTFAGGGTTALPSLVPFVIPCGLFSVSGAWKITTGANVTAVGIGKFT